MFNEMNTRVIAMFVHSDALPATGDNVIMQEKLARYTKNNQMFYILLLLGKR